MSVEVPAMVNWDQASAYCAWQGARLPTDTEWELAARGTDRRTYPWGERAPTCADARFPRVRSCVGDDPANRGLVAGGHYPNDRSPYGVMDMVGNAAEWTADPFTPNYNAALYRPDQPAFQRKVLRAEATFDLPCCPLHARTERAWNVGTQANPPVVWYLGFRCAR
jgi:formylglycine-generating enzyme required for sulfatase activity